VSYRIFHERRRKIMALIPFKARTGLVAAGFLAGCIDLLAWRQRQKAA
jgi:hypothetical protein